MDSIAIFSSSALPTLAWPAFPAAIGEVLGMQPTNPVSSTVRRTEANLNGGLRLDFACDDESWVVKRILSSAEAEAPRPA